MPLAVGTNNVFPLQVEATLAGFAAGAVASGHAEAAEVTSRAKIIDIGIIDGQVMAGQVVGGQSGGSGHAGVALVDVCQVRGAFVGARAVWDAASVSDIVAVIAEPDSVGLSAIAAAVAPCGTLTNPEGCMCAWDAHRETLSIHRPPMTVTMATAGPAATAGTATAAPGASGLL